MTEGATIVRYRDAPPAPALFAGIDTIFFEASGTKSFSDEAARKAFRQLWLGSYLQLDAEHAFLAVDCHGTPLGYLVGALSDPAADARFEELGYFRQLAPHTRHFPAHLHINLAPQCRSLGIGARLIEAFATHAARHGCPGVHVVTGRDMRNVGFYLRNGFAQIATADWKGRVLVMLGRRLGPTSMTCS